MYQNVFNAQRKREGGRKGEREGGKERGRKGEGEREGEEVSGLRYCTHYGKVVDLNPTGHVEWV